MTVKPTNSMVITNSLPPELFQYEIQKISNVITSIKTMGKGSSNLVIIPPKISALRIIKKTASSFLKGRLEFLLQRNFATNTGVIKAKGQLKIKATVIAKTTPVKNRNMLISR